MASKLDSIVDSLSYLRDAYGYVSIDRVEAVNGHEGLPEDANLDLWYMHFDSNDNGYEHCLLCDTDTAGVQKLI